MRSTCPLRSKDQSRSKLNLARTADGGEYASRIVGKVGRGIFENSISITALRERILSIAGNGEVGVIQKVECFRTNNN